jgi:hypothetical protein
MFPEADPRRAAEGLSIWTRPADLEVMTEEDWRLTREEEWMYGAELRLMRFTKPSDDWDHEHCSLCWTTFMEQPDEESVADGFVHGYNRADAPAPLGERTTRVPGMRIVKAPTDEHWVCRECFNDFRQRFGWTALPEDRT